MRRPSAGFIAVLSCLTFVLTGREASAQRKPPIVRTPVTRPPAPATDSTPTKANDKPGAAVEAVVTQAARAWTLPTISYGPLQSRMRASGGKGDLLELADRGAIADQLEEGPGRKVEPRELSTVVGGRNVTSTMLRLRGRDDIEQSDLPGDAKTLLIMHLQKIPADQTDQYVVNPQLAEEWFKTHPKLPATMKPAEEMNTGKKKKKCKAYSTNCALAKAEETANAVEDEAKRAVDNVSEEWERARKQAEDAWDQAAGELSKTWEMAVGCFADRTLRLSDIPVKFAIAPRMSLPIAEAKSKKKKSPASGEVSGEVGLGLPMESNFSAQLDLFYIPCLPFVIRPKALSADGTMTAGEILSASVTATGEFEKTFKIPPVGGFSIPIAMLPIVVGGVPVLELDISAYVEGSVTLSGQGMAEGSFKVENTNTVDFSFACDGKGCNAKSKVARDPVTVTESAQLAGRVSVEPAIYTALQLNVNFNMLSVRAGPKPYLLASMAGCTAGAAQQTEGGGSTTSNNEALIADLDWGVKVRAEALIQGETVGKAFETSATGNRHIWFRDLVGGGSTALVAVVDTAPLAMAGKPARYSVKMPTCYPDTTPVRYRISWTGNATASPTNGCDWARSICTFDPKKDLVIDLTWPVEGSYSITVAPVGDEHGGGGVSKQLGAGAQLRTFEPAPKPTEVAVTVVPAG